MPLNTGVQQAGLFYERCACTHKPQNILLKDYLSIFKTDHITQDRAQPLRSDSSKEHDKGSTLREEYKVSWILSYIGATSNFTFTSLLLLTQHRCRLLLCLNQDLHFIEISSGSAINHILRKCNVKRSRF